jgi:hypothetical protein
MDFHELSWSRFQIRGQQVPRLIQIRLLLSALFTFSYRNISWGIPNSSCNNLANTRILRTGEENAQQHAIHNAQYSRLCALPNELILEIAEQLEASDAACLALSSKQFCRILAPKVWDGVRLQNPGMHALCSYRLHECTINTGLSGQYRAVHEQRQKVLLNLA